MMLPLSPCLPDIDDIAAYADAAAVSLLPAAAATLMPLRYADAAAAAAMLDFRFTLMPLPHDAAAVTSSPLIFR